LATAYDKLFDEYVEELRKAKAFAEAWWDELLAAETKKAGGDAGAAEDAVRRRWPVGPASHPVVIAVIRKYYLACFQLNEQGGSLATGRRGDEADAYDPGLEDEEEPDPDAPAEADDDEDDDDDDEDDYVDEVYPHLFVADWLLDDPTQDLAEFVEVLTYFPIGLDADSDPI
jgi:hypothetical protein